MGSCKAFFLQVQPNFVAHLKLMWNSMLIMALLVLVIRLLYYILNLLADVMDPLNESGGFVSLSWSRRGFGRGDRKGKCNIYGTQWLESQPHLKGVMTS